MAKMLCLPEVTLCAVDTRAPHLALRAMEKSMDSIEFGDRLLVTSAGSLKRVPEGIRLVEIPHMESTQQYSEFMLRHLVKHLQTTHVLIVQWDGYVLNPQVWDDTFLEYDYIGAPWPHFQTELAVGNGGFSLRSRRLFEATSDKAFTVSHPEDLSICHHNRALLETRFGIRFAPFDIASSFSYERERPQGNTFGFHGFFNYPDFMCPAEIRDFLRTLPNTMLVGRDANDLIERLFREKTFSRFWIAIVMLYKSTFCKIRGRK